MTLVNRMIALFLLAVTTPLLAAELPSRVNNAETRFFPPIGWQRENSCAEYSSLYYQLGYELNLLRDAAAQQPENRYCPRFAFNLVNQGGKNIGSEINNGFFVAKFVGVPSEATYGGQFSHELGQWPHGYDKWYAAMKNRAERWEWQRLASLEELDEAKHWLAHCGSRNRTPGGLLTFDGMPYGAKFAPCFDGPQHGKKVIANWGPGPGHIMTLCGYDDSVTLDANGDGKITSDVDISGDGRVDIEDLERGAFIVANSYGHVHWGEAGFAYLPYREFGVAKKRRGAERTLWVARLLEAKSFEPTLTLKITLACDDRQGLAVKVTARTADGGDVAFVPRLFQRGQPQKDFLKPGQDQAAASYGMFCNGRRHMLGRVPMAGKDRPAPLEMGLDLSEFNELLKGQEPESYSLEVGVYAEKEDKHDYNSHGSVLSASVLRYSEGKLVGEMSFTERDVKFEKSQGAVLNAK